MPVNIPGLLVPFQLILNPRIILPSLVVKDIRYIDFTALRRAGYRGAVFDKDNCLTLPHKDTIVPEIQDAWNHCRETFGEGNILIVSNSAGTWMDPGDLQCESVTFHTGVPVLRHRSLKPAYSCIAAIRGYFSSLKSPIQPEELIVVGDRVFTDVVLAKRMRGGLGLKNTKWSFDRQQPESICQRKEPDGPLAIWTTGIWEKEAMRMRWLERKLVEVVQRWTKDANGHQPDTAQFVRNYVETEPLSSGGMMAGLFRSIRRS